MYSTYSQRTCDWQRNNHLHIEQCSTLSTGLCKPFCTRTGKLSMCTSRTWYSIELVILCIRNKSLFHPRQCFLGSRPGFLRMVARVSLQVPDTLCVQWEWEEHTLYAMGLSPVARISRKCDSQPDSGLDWLQRARENIALCRGSPGYTENTL